MKNLFAILIAVAFYHFTATGFPQVSSPFTAEFAQLRTNLYIIAPDGTNVLMDGTLTQYDTDYSNDVNGMDARKMFNSSENFGMPRGNTILIIERRHSIEQTDSIFFKMWNMRNLTYKLELVPVNMQKSGRIGLLEDNFLKTATPIDLKDTSYITFSVTNDPASKVSDRFRIIFSTLVNLPTPLPFSFTWVSASKENNGVIIGWKTLNQSEIRQYIIERSADEKNFFKSTEVTPNNSKSGDYQWMDASPAEGHNYYRISSVGANGNVKYSDVAGVYVEKRRSSGIRIYPNPVTNGTIHLQFMGQPEGVYRIRVLDKSGNVVLKKQMTRTADDKTGVIQLPSSLPHGMYLCEITGPDGTFKNIQVLY